MSDPSQKKPCKTNTTESQPDKTHRVKGLSTKKLSDNDLRGLIRKAEAKIEEIYHKILKELKVFQENELQAYKNYSQEELAKADVKFKEYSARIRDILEESIKRLETFKNGLKIKMMTYEEVQSLITYFEKKIDQSKKLTQDTIKNIHETIKDPKLKTKFVAIVETNYERVKSSMNALYDTIKESSIVGEHEYKCIKSESTSGKSLKSITMSYIVRIIAYARGLISGKSGRTEIPMSQDIKNLLIVTEVKIKELYGGILEKVKDLHENELQTYKNYSKEELAKVRSNLQEYSDKILKLSEDMVKCLNAFKNKLQTQIITHEDFQSLVSYFDGKILKTKKLTENMIKHIQATIKEPTLGKKLETMVETHSEKIKIAMDDLYAAIKKNFIKIGQLKSLPEKNSLFSKISKFGETKTSINSPSAASLPSNNNEGAATDSKGNAAVGLNKEKIPFFNLSKHFNSKTIYGRANVAKATYAGVILYYIYRKVKNTTT